MKLLIPVLAAVLALAGCNKGGADPAEMAKSAAEAKAFMATNAKAESVQTLPSGV